MGASQQALLMVSGVVAPQAFIMIPTGANGSSTFTDTGPSPVTITNVGLPTITSNKLVLNGSSTLNATKDIVFSLPSGGNFVAKAVFNSVNVATDTFISSWRDNTFAPPQWFIVITAAGAINLWDASISVGAPTAVSSGSLNNGADHTVIWRKVGTAYTLEVDASVVASYTGPDPRVPVQTGRSFCIGGGGVGVSTNRFVGTMGEVSMTLA